MATKQTTTEKSTTDTQSGWAAEKARAIAGNDRSAQRFARLAQVLLDAECEGERFLSFAAANERAALARGLRGDPAASWRLALQRTRQLVGGLDGWRVDAERLALVHDRLDQ